MPQGTVKWFNNAKGYGFIVEDNETEDLFAHFSSIQMEGYKTLKAGQSVNFEKQPGDKGFHAVNITAVEINADSVDHNEFISVEKDLHTHTPELQSASQDDSTKEELAQSKDKTASA